MNNSSIPIEVLDAVIQEFIAEYPKVTEDRKFLPHWQWNLAPLLHVCKLWCAVTERYMYKFVSIGKSFPRATSSEALESRAIREGFEIANELLVTLSTNPRLAAHVEELQLAIKDVTQGDAREWTQSSIHIIQSCPNLKHVEIRGFDASERDDLAEALKEKSLVSFHISPHGLAIPKSIYPRAADQFRIFELLQRWPKLQTLRVMGFAQAGKWAEGASARIHLKGHRSIELLPSATSAHGSFDAFTGSDCCPELKYIQFVGNSLISIDLKHLRAASSCVTRIDISIFQTREDSLLENLCECLRTWSQTLDCARLRLNVQYTSYHLLFESLSTLAEVRELQIFSGPAPDVDFNSIAGLSRLERL